MNAVARFYTKDAAGVRVPLGDIPELLQALRSGALRGDDLLYDEVLGAWGKARDHDAYRVARPALIASQSRALRLLSEYPRTFASIAVVALGVAMNPAGNPVESIGYSLGAAFIGAVLSYPLFRGNRPKVRSGSFVFLLVACASVWTGWSSRKEEKRVELAQRLERLRETIDSSALTYGEPASMSAPSPPPAVPRLSDDDVATTDRIVVAVTIATEQIERIGHETARTRFGIDISSPPPEWLETEYIANASRYPNVGEYWRQYAKYIEHWGLVFASVTDSVLTVQLAEAGVDKADALSTREGAMGRSAEARAIVRLSARTVQAAGELHRTLVAFDNELTMSEDGAQWIYQRDETSSIIQRRMAALQAVSDSVDNATKLFQRRSASFAESLRKATRAR